MVSQMLKILRGIMVRNSEFSETSFFVVCDDIWIAIYPPVVVVLLSMNVHGKCHRNIYLKNNEKYYLSCHGIEAL
jgi:hypothetical protein